MKMEIVILFIIPRLLEWLVLVTICAFLIVDWKVYQEEYIKIKYIFLSSKNYKMTIVFK